jgi:hypothetical protein
MQLDVYRKTETARSIIGQLMVDGQAEAVTLEPSRTTPVHLGHPCIPAGTYPVRLTLSPHFGYITPEVFDVLGRSEIRLHRGNKPEDSLGCTLIGSVVPAHTPDFIGASETAFDKLMTILNTATDSIAITYHDPS